MENTDTKKMQISDVKIIAGGLKGLEVKYAAEGKDELGRGIIDDMWLGRKVPVGPKLMEIINSFRFYLYDIYGYDLASINQAEMEVTGIKSGNGSFLLSGKMKVLDGTKVVPMNTPLITSQDEYDKFMEVDKLIGQLYASVAEYMEGKHTMNSADYVKKFYEGKKDKKGELVFDVVAFDALPKEEQEAKALEILAKGGGYAVIPVANLPELLEGLEAETAEVIPEGPVVKMGEVEMSTTNEKPADMSVVPNFEAKSPVVEKKAEDLIAGNEEDLVLNVTPVNIAS